MSARPAAARRISGPIAALLIGFGPLAAQPVRAPRPAPAAPPAAPLEITPERPLLDLGRMWTYDAPPTAYWRARYGFTADAAWLTRLRRSALRLPGCSASFVSAHGLVLTNHHCVREAVTQVQPADSSYQETGFVAGSLAGEKPVRGLVAERLERISDVTDAVRRALSARDDVARARQRRETIAAVEGACEQRTRRRCEVVTLHQGARFALYEYTAFTDVRLVAVPEAQAAFFGGDADNFTYPRWNLDFALLRVYDDRGRPLAPGEFLPWNNDGVREGDLVFVTGNPGATRRLETVAQLEFARDHGLPLELAALERQRDALAAVAGPAPSPEVMDELFGLENAIKTTRGAWAGLGDSTLMARKRRFEADLRRRVAADPARRLAYGAAWGRIAEALGRQAAVARPAHYAAGTGSELWALTMAALRLPVMAALPDAERLAPYRGAGLGRIRAQLLAPLAVDTARERRRLAALLADAVRDLPPGDPVRRQLLAGRTPEAAAAALVRGTRMGDAAERRKLVLGGARAAAASTDPLVVALRAIEPHHRALAAVIERAQATVANESARVGEAQGAVYGALLPPDATFTLRIQDGVVAGYPMNGTRAPWFTSLFGLYGRWTEFGRTGPWRLPERWIARRDRLDLAQPFNFVSTNDIVGGNSGSPVVNRAGELVGLAFDGNVESLPGEFLFDDRAARTVSVHAGAITMALRLVYDAPHLADELEGKAPPRR